MMIGARLRQVAKITCDAVVEADNLVPISEVAIHEVRADEPGRSRDCDFQEELRRRPTFATASKGRPC